MRSCFLSSVVEFRSVVSEEKLKLSQPIRGQGGHLVFPIGPKNTNLEEDVQILLPVKFRWIPISGFRGEVKTVSSNQRSGVEGHHVFPINQEKYKLGGRGLWDLASVQVSLNYVKRFQRRSRKCEKLTTTDGRQTDDRRTDGRRKTFNDNSALERSAQVHWKWQMQLKTCINGILKQGAQRTERHKLGRWRWDLANCQVLLNALQWFQRSKKCFSQSETNIWSLKVIGQNCSRYHVHKDL